MPELRIHLSGRAAGGSAYRLSCMEHGLIDHIIGLAAATAAAAEHESISTPCSRPPGAPAP